MKKSLITLLLTATICFSSGCVATRKFTRHEVKTSSDTLNARIDSTNGELKETRDNVDRVNQRVTKPTLICQHTAGKIMSGLVPRYPGSAQLRSEELLYSSGSHRDIYHVAPKETWDRQQPLSDSVRSRRRDDPLQHAVEHQAHAHRYRDSDPPVIWQQRKGLRRDAGTRCLTRVRQRIQLYWLNWRRRLRLNRWAMG